MARRHRWDPADEGIGYSGRVWLCPAADWCCYCCLLRCMIREDESLVCWGGGGSDYVGTLSPTVSTEDAYGVFGQIGSGDNNTIGDEVSPARGDERVSASPQGKISEICQPLLPCKCICG